MRSSLTDPLNEYNARLQLAEILSPTSLDVVADARTGAESMAMFAQGGGKPSLELQEHHELQDPGHPDYFISCLPSWVLMARSSSLEPDPGMGTRSNFL